MKLHASWKSLGALLSLAGSLVAMPATAQEVVLRHGLQGPALDALATLTLKFNDAQRGKAKVVLQDVRTLSAADKAKLPDLALLDPDESKSFFGSRPRFVPLYQVMKGAGEKLDVSDVLPQVADAVDDEKGNLEALPVALALPVLFRNKDAFKKAGLDPDKPPQTWMQVQDVAGKLFDAGSSCPLTSTYFSRLHAENVSTQHGESITAKSGKSERVTLNKLINVKHLALLASWQKSLYFQYYGPHREAEQHFLSGECAMITADTTLFARLPSSLNVGASELPYHDDDPDASPAKVLPDGASLWTLPGKKKDEYKVVARYLRFFALPENQKDWVKATAYLPMTRAAFVALRDAKVFPPQLLLAAESRLATSRRDSGRVSDENKRSEMHEILDQEISGVWTSNKPAKEALDNAMSRVNRGK